MSPHTLFSYQRRQLIAGSGPSPKNANGRLQTDSSHSRFLIDGQSPTESGWTRGSVVFLEAAAREAAQHRHQHQVRRSGKNE